MVAAVGNAAASGVPERTDAGEDFSSSHDAAQVRSTVRVVTGAVRSLCDILKKEETAVTVRLDERIQVCVCQ